MYLITFAGDKKADTIVLSGKFEVECFLELLQIRVLVARDGNGRGLVLSGLSFDLVFEGVIVDVVDAPLRYGLLLKPLAKFHLVTSMVVVVVMAATAAAAYQCGRTSLPTNARLLSVRLFGCSRVLVYSST